MTTGFLSRRGLAAMFGPVSLLLIPKCPLCILPLLAGLGIGFSRGLVINVLVGLIAVGWTWFVFSAASSIILRVVSVVVTLLVVVGRVFPLMPGAATYSVVAVMILFGFFVSRRCRNAGCESPPNHLHAPD